MKIKELRLYTDKLRLQKFFYTDVLAMPLLEESASHFGVKAGATNLFFESGESAYYHFAFNIPYNMTQSALEWVKSNVVILTDEGTELIDFPNWNAKAIYFEDPAGNILEFIGREDVKVESHKSNFDPSDILNISEVGLPGNDPLALRKKLEEHLNIPHYSGDSPRFYAMGNPHGLFILVNQHEKKWYPTDIAAKAFPLKVTVQQGKTSFKIDYNVETGATLLT